MITRLVGCWIGCLLPCQKCQIHKKLVVGCPIVTNSIGRVAEVGSLSVRAKTATKLSSGAYLFFSRQMCRFCFLGLGPKSVGLAKKFTLLSALLTVKIFLLCKTYFPFPNILLLFPLLCKKYIFLFQIFFFFPFCFSFPQQNIFPFSKYFPSFPSPLQKVFYFSKYCKRLPSAQ